MSDPEIAAAAHRVFDRKAQWHHEQASLQLKEKVRILLELQRIDLPLLARRRPLKPWERPWEVEP
jgi:hypothetical protein